LLADRRAIDTASALANWAINTPKLTFLMAGASGEEVPMPKSSYANSKPTVMMQPMWIQKAVLEAGPNFIAHLFNAGLIRLERKSNLPDSLA
jgi:hypothetical protein